MDLPAFEENSKKLQRRNRDFYTRLKRRPPKELDSIFHEEHEAAFEKIDCLSCANCCKTTSPIFYQRDIEKAAKHLRMKPGDFLSKYLRIDEDKDYVLKTAPCPFLETNNHCSIYSSRPAACREYPHTNRKNMHQVLDLAYRNTLVCPAVLRITERILNKIKL
jgi:Fe-S-cluster containining protein